jgi:hypothetical protein
MKKSTMKTIVVKLASDNMFEITVDTSIFDDPYIEAATQAIEQCKLKKYGIIRPILECWELKDSTTPKKHQLFNSYWILVNAALYEKAETLREKMKGQTDVDLSKEPMRGNVKQ